MSAGPPCQVGLLVGRLGDTGLIGPKLDTLVLKVVVGIGATAAGLGGSSSVASPPSSRIMLEKPPSTLMASPVVKSERLDARNMTALAISLTSPMRRVAIRRLRLFSTSGSA